MPRTLTLIAAVLMLPLLASCSHDWPAAVYETQPQQGELRSELEQRLSRAAVGGVATFDDLRFSDAPDERPCPDCTGSGRIETGWPAITVRIEDAKGNVISETPKPAGKHKIPCPRCKGKGRLKVPPATKGTAKTNEKPVTLTGEFRFRSYWHKK